MDAVQWWVGSTHMEGASTSQGFEFTVHVYLMYSAVCFPIPCKTGVLPVHSENDSADQQYTVVPIQICTDVLEHTVLQSMACTDW